MIINQSEVLYALEEAWKLLQKTAADLPPVRIIVANFGPPVDVDDDPKEVFIPEPWLSYGAVATFGALTHEAAHVLAEVRRLRDTTRGGRYHNQTFIDIVHSLGFSVITNEVTHDSYVTLEATDPFSAHHRVLGHLSNVLPLHEITYGTTTDTIPALKCRPQRIPRPGKRGAKATCRCDPPRHFEMFPGVLAAGPIVCGLCGYPFLHREKNGS